MKKRNRIGRSSLQGKMGFYLTYVTPSGTSFGDVYLAPSSILYAPEGHHKVINRLIRKWRKTHKGYRVRDVFFSTGRPKRRTSRRRTSGRKHYYAVRALRGVGKHRRTSRR